VAIVYAPRRPWRFPRARVLELRGKIPRREETLASYPGTPMVSRCLLRELYTRDTASSFRAKHLLMDTLGFQLLNERARARARARGTFLPRRTPLSLLSKRIGGLAFFLITYRLSVADGVVASASPRYGQPSKFELRRASERSFLRARVLAEFLARGPRPDVRKFPRKFVRRANNSTRSADLVSALSRRGMQ